MACGGSRYEMVKCVMENDKIERYLPRYHAEKLQKHGKLKIVEEGKK